MSVVEIRQITVVVGSFGFIISEKIKTANFNNSFDMGKVVIALNPA